jgi:hypothetical protein
MAFRARAHIATGILTAVLLAGVARAQPTPAEKETARSLMVEGRARRERHDLKGALESFRAADAIMHVTTTGYEVARAQVALGQLVEARDTLGRVLRIPARPDEPRPFVEGRANAQQLDEDLAARIPAIRLVLQGAPPSAATVQVDEDTIPPEAASAPLKVNPGHHAIVVHAGAASGRAEVDITERATKTVTIELTAPAGAPVIAQEAAPEHHEEARSHTMRTIAYGGFGLAIAGAAVGSITGLMSLSKTSAVKQSCVDNACPPSVAGDLDTARTTATVSTVAFAAAGVGLAVGITAILIGDKDPARSEAARAHVTPFIGFGSAGVRGAF